ncbi:MAG TPA: hypothetical protein VMH61_09325, partial [Candidatus Acidoferrales bacterium]|nr:hypothetical protein [Candidatus Acidoferrales bacterium]
PDALPEGALESARALIGASILAPSYWNSQPWRFEVDGTEIRLTLDGSRAMPLSDPELRFAQLSLGAALENLLIAARAWGAQPSVRYLPWGLHPRAGAPFVAASVTWASGEPRRDRTLFEALPHRRSNPRHFDARPLTLPQRAALLAQVPGELNLHWIDDRADIRGVATIVHDATLARARDDATQAERARWLRLSDGDEARTGDGVTPDRLGLNGPLGWLAARTLHPHSRGFGWGTSSYAHEAEEGVHSSGALALLTAPQRQDATYLLGGQAYERLALQATTLGLAQQPLAAPIESELHRGALARAFGAAGEEPLLLVRLGRAHPVPPTSRRTVALVSTYRTS